MSCHNTPNSVAYLRVMLPNEGDEISIWEGEQNKDRSAGTESKEKQAMTNAK